MIKNNPVVSALCERLREQMRHAENYTRPDSGVVRFCILPTDLNALLELGAGGGGARADQAMLIQQMIQYLDHREGCTRRGTPSDVCSCGLSRLFDEGEPLCGYAALTCRALLGGGADRPKNLFRQGEHTLHSGENSLWKIECDALTDADIETLALMLMTVLPEFGSVEGVPRGGLRIADALRGYATKGPLLIVDDVTTTGYSLEQQRAGRDALGAVLFARQDCPPWVTPLFQMPTKRAAVPPVVPPPPEADLIAQLQQDIETLKREGKYKAVEDDFDGDGTGGDWYVALANRIEHLISLQAVDHESRRSDGDEQRVTGRVAGGSVDVAPSARTASGVELIGVRPEQGHVQPRDIQQVQRQTVKSAAGSNPADSLSPVRPSLAGLIAQWRAKAAKMKRNAADTVVESLIAQFADALKECADQLEALLRVGAVAPPVAPNQELADRGSARRPEQP